VEIRCVCPPKADGSPRHDHDEITLRDNLPFETVSSARWAVAMERELNPGVTVPEVFGKLSTIWIVAGVETWTIVDEKNKPVEVTPANVRGVLFAPQNMDVGIAVGDEADRKYSEVMLPLVTGASPSSPATPINGSTSPKRPTSHKSPKPSSPSSITTIPTGGTEATSNALDGDSNLSPKSVSAA
jgi:hypothetical protein